MVQTHRLKKKIIVIGGPTCVGKSGYAVELARKYNGEIISADSVQIYKCLNIGSGKITKEEMKGIPHHMLDIIGPLDSFTVIDFVEQADKLIDEITSRGKLPIIVGGTGFYIDMLLNGYTAEEVEPNYELRERMHILEELNGKGYLRSFVRALDPNSKLDSADMPRLERQLEIHLSPTADEEEDGPIKEKYDALLIIMDAERSILHEYASKRIAKMLNDGLLDEVRSLYRFRRFKCMTSVGYREAVDGIEMQLSKGEIASMMEDSYHNLIKRQQAYFRWIKCSNKIYLYNHNAKNTNLAVKEFVKNGHKTAH